MAAILLIVLGIGAFCAALYTCAVYALPVYVGLFIGFWAINTGAGAIGGFVVGIVTGGLVFVVGQAIFALARWPPVRLLVALVFAVPATLAGYSIVQQLWALAMPPTFWRFVFGVVAAAVAGGMAVTRLARRPDLRPASR